MSKTYRRLGALTTCLACLIISASVLGQSENPPRVADKNSSQNLTEKKESAKPSTPAPSNQLKIGNIDFSGSLRLRVENYGWWETPGFEDSYTFGAAILR